MEDLPPTTHTSMFSCVNDDDSVKDFTFTPKILYYIRGDILGFAVTGTIWTVVHRALHVHVQCIPGLSNQIDCKFASGLAKSPLHSYPLVEETIDSLAEYMILIGVWLFVCVTSIGFSKYTSEPRHFGLHLKSWINILLQCVFLSLFNQMTTGALKFAVGRPRPNYWNIKSTHKYKQARQSFVSGHSALSYATMTLLTHHFLESISYYRRHRIFLMRSQTKNIALRDPLYEQQQPGCVLWGPLWKYLVNKQLGAFAVVLACFPLVIATIIAVTRLTDYFHHYADVIGGAIVGFGVQCITWSAYYERFFGDPYAQFVEIHKHLLNENDTTQMRPINGKNTTNSNMNMGNECKVDDTENQQ